LTHTCAVTRRERADRKPRMMADYAQSLANRGGGVRAKALTAKEHTTIGKKGTKARWLKRGRSS